jgi:hypothetical protein
MCSDARSQSKLALEMNPRFEAVSRIAEKKLAAVQSRNGFH